MTSRLDNVIERFYVFIVNEKKSKKQKKVVFCLSQSTVVSHVLRNDWVSLECVCFFFF